MKLLSLALLSAAAAAELRFQPLPAPARRALLSRGDLTGLWGQLTAVSQPDSEEFCTEKIPDPDGGRRLAKASKKSKEIKESNESNDSNESKESSMDGDSSDSAKVKFAPCDNAEPSQMWKFDSGDGDDDGGRRLDGSYDGGYDGYGDYGDYGGYGGYDGMLQSMTGGCLAVRGTVKKGRNLKVLECDSDSDKQRWSFYGGDLSLEGFSDLCVGSKTASIVNRGPVHLLKCDDTDSLDYAGTDNAGYGAAFW